VSTNWLVTQLLPCFDSEHYLVHWWKMFIVSAPSNMEAQNQVSRNKQTNHLTSGACWCTILLESAKVKLSPQVCESDHFRHFCGYNVKTFNSLSSMNQISSPSTQGSYSASLSTPVATSQFVLAAHYDVRIVTTSKEYLTISHISSKYFKLVFLQLHLVKISCKLIIIWLSYKRN